MRMPNIDLSIPFVDQAFKLIRGDSAAEVRIEALRLYEMKSVHLNVGCYEFQLFGTHAKAVVNEIGPLLRCVYL